MRACVSVRVRVCVCECWRARVCVCVCARVCALGGNLYKENVQRTFLLW